MKKKNYILIIAAAILFNLINNPPVSAHASIVWAYVEGNKVYVEAFFANGGKIKNTRVVVIDENERIVIEGKTDNEGKFVYQPLSKKAQTIVIMAGDSHVGDFELTQEDLKKVELKKKNK